MVLGKLPVPGRPTIWIRVGQGPTALSVGTGGGCLDIFTLVYHFSFLSPSLWETARYRLKYCLKGPLSPKQPTNQPSFLDDGIKKKISCIPDKDIRVFYLDRRFLSHPGPDKNLAYLMHRLFRKLRINVVK